MTWLAWIGAIALGVVVWMYGPLAILLVALYFRRKDESR